MAMNIGTKLLMRLLLCALACLLGWGAQADCVAQIAWSRTYNSPASSADGTHGVAVDGSGDVVVVGYENRPDLGQDRNWLIQKYDSTGNLLWFRTHNGPLNGMDEARGVAIGSKGEIVIAGDEFTATVSDWLIQKYDSSGTLLWSRTYNSPANNFDKAHAVAVDTSGNVIAVGWEQRSDLSEAENWFIRKYDPNGNVLWSRTYNGPINSDDRAEAVAVDAAGNVVVVGWHWTVSFNALIRKYDPAGNFLWSRSFDDPESDPDRAHGVAIDSAGNIVVVGFEQRLGELGNWMIQKFDTNGTFLWSQTYNDPDDNWDRALGVAIDSNDDVVVVGREQIVSADYRWLTRKYDSSGTLLWSRAYDSPGGGFDEARAVAVDGNYQVYVAGREDRSDLSESVNWRILKYQTTACFDTAVTISSLPVATGQWVTIVLTVTNTGAVNATNVMPFLQLNSGASLIEYQDGPLPPGPTPLSVGAAQSFTWTYSVSGVGTVNLTLTATGIDSGIGGPVSDSVSTNVVAVSSTLLISALSIVPDSVSAGEWVEIVLTVSNTGGESIIGVMPQLTINSGTSYVVNQSGPTPAGPVTLTSSGSQTFTWTYSTSGVGSVTFVGGATGTDAVFGYTMMTSSSGVLTISPTILPLYSGPVRVYPNPYNPATAIRGTVKFEGLPLGAKVRIYTPRGLKVWEGEVVTPYLVEWDGRSEGGRQVAPGTYLWIAEGDGTKERGTLIVQ